MKVTLEQARRMFAAQGGRSRSEAKAEAGRTNLARARAALAAKKSENSKPVKLSDTAASSTD